MATPNKNIRPSFFKRKYIVNPNMQWKIIFQLIFTGFVLLAGFYYFEMTFLNKFLQLPADGCLEANKVICQRSLLLKSTLDKLFLLKALLIVICLLFWGVIFSHKIAGPVFRITKTLICLKEGQLPRPINLRKGDLLHDIACLVNELIEERKKPRKE